MHTSVHVELLWLMTLFVVRLGLISVEVADPTAG